MAEDRENGGSEPVAGKGPAQADIIEGLFPADADGQSSAAAADRPRLTAVGGRDSLNVPVQEFFIPIHDFVRLTRREVAVVDHPAFQRLGYVFQLGQTYLVYRGATHLRHEHALGTLHMAQMIIDALDRNVQLAEMEKKEEQREGAWKIDARLSEQERALVRLGALLHDIGHLPAGHTFEDELGLFAKHDSVERLELVLDRTDWSGEAAEPLRELIDRLYESDIDEIGIEASACEVLLALIAGDYSKVRSKKDRLVGSERFRLGVGRDLIGNTICADLLDYLHRDSHHLGKHKRMDTRLIEYMEVRRLTAGTPSEGEESSKLLIDLRDGDEVRHDAVSGVLDLLESRYQLFEMALYHRTKLAAAAMLERAVAEIAEARSGEWLKGLPEELLEVSDFEMLSHFETAAKDAKPRSIETKERLRVAASSLVAIKQRRLSKKLYQRFQDQFTLSEANRIQQLYAHKPDSEEREGAPAKNRLRALRQLEADFGLTPLSLGMYCPPAKMSTKVAEVAILRDGEVRSLADQEKLDTRLTGGHLGAQEQRFKNLWHVYFSCDPGVLEGLQKRDLYPLLIDAINCCVLGVGAGPVSLEERARMIAQALAGAPESPWKGRQVVEKVARAKRGAKKPSAYPTRLPALTEFYE